MTPARHFHTFTGNLLAERTLDFAAWTPGKTHRAQRASFQVGGKGVNVAKMLRRFGAPTTAWCFLGGPTGEECRAWLQAQELPFAAFAQTDANRTGTVVRAPGQPETTFFSPDVAPDAAAWHAAAAALDALPPDALFAVCGSSPGWATTEASPFRAALARAMARGLPVVVDAYGPPLLDLVARPVALVKINADELRALLGADADTETNLRAALARWPAQAWIVSDGPRPVWYAARGETPANIAPPRVQEVSATGSGDVLLAAVLLARWQRGYSWRAALEFALPYAAANAAHPGVADFPRDNSLPA
ncbi:MAG: hypothetical protein HZA31_06375 [Opitutae bacterium]|nr:hypothetical protein [Opitutae bacterium]